MQYINIIGNKKCAKATKTGHQSSVENLSYHRLEDEDGTGTIIKIKGIECIIISHNA